MKTGLTRKCLQAEGKGDGFYLRSASDEIPILSETFWRIKGVPRGFERFRFNRRDIEVRLEKIHASDFDREIIFPSGNLRHSSGWYYPEGQLIEKEGFNYVQGRLGNLYRAEQSDVLLK